MRLQGWKARQREGREGKEARERNRGNEDIRKIRCRKRRMAKNTLQLYLPISSTDDMQARLRSAGALIPNLALVEDQLLLLVDSLLSSCSYLIVSVVSSSLMLQQISYLLLYFCSIPSKSKGKQSSFIPFTRFGVIPNTLYCPPIPVPSINRFAADSRSFFRSSEVADLMSEARRGASPREVRNVD